MQFHWIFILFIWFHEFFCLDFFKFCGPLWVYQQQQQQQQQQLQLIAQQQQLAGMYYWKFKKVQAKKLVKSNKLKKFFREIVFLAVLNFSLLQKLIFGHFWNCKKLNLVKKNSWNWFIWFHEVFFALDFLNFLVHCDTFNVLTFDFSY